MEKKRRNLWVAWLLVIPVLLVRGFTTLYPIIVTFINSTYDMSLLKGGDFQFIGLDNYIRIFQDYIYSSFDGAAFDFRNWPCDDVEYEVQGEKVFEDNSVDSLGDAYGSCRSCCKMGIQ